MVLKVTEYNARIRKLVEEDEPTMNPIGFTLKEENDE